MYFKYWFLVNLLNEIEEIVILLENILDVIEWLIVIFYDYEIFKKYFNIKVINRFLFYWDILSDLVGKWLEVNFCLFVILVVL